MTSFTAFSAILVLCGSLLAAPVQAGPKGNGPLDPGQVFESLGQAVEAGAVQARLAELLRKGKPVQTLAVFDAPDAQKAFADGNPGALERAQSMMRATRESIIKDLDLPVSRTFTLLPVLMTPLSNEDRALQLINQRLVVSLWVDGEMELWLGNSLPRIGHPMVAAASGLRGTGAAVAILDTGADPAIVSNIIASFEAAPADGSVDDNGHGTRVSAVVSAVAPGAGLLPIDIMDGGKIFDHDVLAGLNWVLGRRYQYNIKVVNMSFGRDDYHLTSCANSPSPYHGAFSMMRQSNMLPIVSAGNHAMRGGSFRQGVALPACVPGAVAVGASYTSSSGTDEVWPDCTDKAPVTVDTPACSSASAPRLDIFAPGSRITAGGGVSNGTSIAAPHVAGAAAILASINPWASAATLQTQLTTSSVQILDPRTSLTRPRLNLPDTIRAAAPVPNDNRSSATLLTKWSGRAQQTTWTATKEAGEASHGGNGGGSSIWFRWLPSQSGFVDITTEGSDFDTLLAVYRVDSSGNSILLKDNNDAGSSMTSAVTVQVNAGDVIEIAIDGVRFTGVPFGASGHANLTWNLPNDDIADATYLAPAVGTVIQGSNIGATKQPYELNNCGDIYSNASVWYRWTPAVNQTVRLRASGAQMLCAAVYRTPASVTAPIPNQITVVTSAADDQGYPIDFTFTGQAGEAYWIAIDGVSREYACYPNGMCDYVTPTGVFNLRLE